MSSDSFLKILKEIPLKTRLLVSLECHFLYKNGGTPFIPLDKDGEELPEAIEANRKALEGFEEIRDLVNDRIDEWIADGKPE